MLENWNFLITIEKNMEQRAIMAQLVHATNARPLSVSGTISPYLRAFTTESAQSVLVNQSQYSNLPDFQERHHSKPESILR